MSEVNIKYCGICKRDLKRRQKKFCSSICQAKNASISQIKPRKKKQCILCQNIFLFLPSRHHKNIYCSRKCKDLHQKVIYQGEKNPSWGRRASKQERLHRSSLMQKKWATDLVFRQNVKNGQLLFMSSSGHWPGSDSKSKKRRSETLLERYGVTHVWNDASIRLKCETTCLKRYGKHSWEIMIDAIPNKNTKIERITAAILEKHNIDFKQQFRVYYNERRYKQFDFFLPKINMLIETDGDYWHGHPEAFPILNEVQNKNCKNDEYKNILAAKNGYQIKRFWETDIHKKDFEAVFLTILRKAGI